MYLAISPDVDNPDDLSGGEEQQQSISSAEAQKPPVSSPSSSKRAKMVEKAPPTPIAAAQTFAVDLPDAPVDEVSGQLNRCY